MLSVKILVLIMFGLFLLSAVSIVVVLYKWLSTEKGLPASTRVVVTVVPLLIFFPFAHQTGNQKEVKQRALFSVACFVGGLFMFFYLQWLKNNA